jgi:hypothetical protein
LCALSFAQKDNNLITVKGRVLDEATGAPLEFVNIFLANTTIGTTSGNNGEFTLNNIPFGTYDLIFSYVGYETDQNHLSSYKPGVFNYTIKLKPKPINLNPVNVEAAESEEKIEDWKANFKEFKKYFIGETDNSSKTKILNPEVLNFAKDKLTKIFKAYSDSVLKIENRALGYMMFIVLDSLVYIPGQVIEYRFYPRFEELTPSSEKEKQRWEDNRQYTYLNSPKHFYYSLVHKRLFKDHYTLKSVGGEKIFPEYLQLTTDADSTIYEFRFNGTLSIERFVHSASILNFYYPSVSIDKFGNLSSTFSTVGIYGYWADQRIADTLPYDYVYLEK